MRIKNWVGLAIAVAAVIGAWLAEGGKLSALLQATGFTVVAGTAVGLTLLGHRPGMSRREVLLRARTHTLHGAAFCVILGGIVILGSAPTDLAQLGPKIAILLVPVLYGVVGAALLDAFTPRASETSDSSAK